MAKSNTLQVAVEGTSASSLSITGTSGCYVIELGMYVQFSASWSGGVAPYKWEWVWPDGYNLTCSQSSGTSGTAANCRFFASGTTSYTSANFTVTDSLGNRASATVKVTEECVTRISGCTTCPS